MPSGPDHRDFAAILSTRGYRGLQKIGEGSYGVAVLVEDASGFKVVCKMVDVGRASPKEVQEAKSESRLLARLEHPYIVRYRESFSARGWLGIVMDFCEGGDLGAQIQTAKKEKSPIAEEKILRWFTQAMLALRYLHGEHVLHRDLKPCNLFLANGGDDLRVGDFGVSRAMACTAAFAHTQIGTPYYLSPEVIQDKPYTWPSDVWAMGCILYELCALRVPFQAKNIAVLAQKICSRVPVPKIPLEYSEPLRELCGEMMNRNPGKRPKAEQIVTGRPVVQCVAQALEEVKSAPSEEVSAGTVAKFEVMDLFRKFDINGNGVIDRDELGRLLKHLDAEVWTEDSIDQMLREADLNNDGAIQFDEFVNWIFGASRCVGLVEQSMEIIELAHKAAGEDDLPFLCKTLLRWRQVIDIGCLRVSPPATSAKTCESLAWLALSAGGLLEGSQDVTQGFEAAKQMFAILHTVEELLDASARRLVRKVAVVASRSVVRGLGFELVDGTRVGQGLGLLSDACLQSCSARWESLAVGEHIIEIRGFGASATSGRCSEKRPGAGQDSRSQASRLDKDALAASTILRTSHGRELEFGNRVATNGKSYSFVAPDGEEITEAFFAGGICTGIQTAPLVVSWPTDKVEDVRAAFCLAADSVCSLLLRLSWRVGRPQGKYALLQASRLGLERPFIPTDVNVDHRRRSFNTSLPSHWNMSRSGHGPTTDVGKVRLADSQRKALQAFLDSSFHTNAAPRTPAKKAAGHSLELMSCHRLESWKAWVDFAHREEEIMTDLRDLTSGEGQASDPMDDVRTSERHLDAVEGTALNSCVNAVWLFRGVSRTAAEGVLRGDQVDFDRAVGSEAEDRRLYGQGVYLTECCSRADELAAAASAPASSSTEDVHHLLLCRCMLGRVLRDDNVLPDIVRLVGQCVGGPYHSVVGDRRERCPESFRQFVVYDKDQVYPEFLISCRRVYRPPRG